MSEEDEDANEEVEDTAGPLGRLRVERRRGGEPEKSEVGKQKGCGQAWL